MTTFPTGTRANAIAVGRDSAILVRTNGDGLAPKLIKVDPVSGAKTTISTGNFLSKSSGSRGLSIESSTSVVSAESGAEDGTIVRINTVTGAQKELLRRDRNDVNDVAVAVNQIPPPPVVTAKNDSFTTNSASPTFVSDGPRGPRQRQ